MLKKKSKGVLTGIAYTFFIMIASMGSSLLLSGLLFGQSGFNETMVEMNNLLMGILGTPIIILITKRYYKKHFPASAAEVDFFTHDTFKKILFGTLTGLLIISILFFILYALGADVTYQGIHTSTFSLFTGVATFIGMAVLEECIYRGVLRKACTFLGEKHSISLPIILFAAMHTDTWSNPSLLRILDLLLAGMLFTILIQNTGSLLFTSTVHATMNIGTVIIFGLDDNEGIFKTNVTSTILGLSPEQITTILSIALSLFISVFIILIVKSKKSTERKNLL